jgi:hypothetical protein
MMISDEDKNKIDLLFKIFSDGIGNRKSCKECVHVDVCFIRCTYQDTTMGITALLRRHHGSSLKRLEELGHKDFVFQLFAGLCQNYLTNEEARNQIY